VKLNHGTVSTLALAQEVFSEEKHVAGSEGGSITVQTAIKASEFPGRRPLGLGETLQTSTTAS
jgi:hypothetical protein